VATQGTVRILTGPPACGKTDRALDEYCDRVARHGYDAALYLVPTQRVADLIRGRLVARGETPRPARSLRGLFDFRVMTFGEVADVLLVANHASVAAVSEPQRLALLQTVLAHMDGAELGPLVHHRGRPGLLTILAQDLDELKAAGVRHEELQAATRDLRGGSLARALAAVYSHYQQELARLELYDDPGRLWAAQELLDRGETRPFGESLRIVIADGFSDLTTIQLRVLASLVETAGEALITLTCEPDEARRELRFTPERMLEALHTHLEPVASVTRELMPCRGEPRSDLDYLRRNLFLPTAERRSGTDGSVVVMRAPGPWAEVQLAAREVKKLLSQGGGEGPIRAQDIALVARDLDPYQQALREVFAEYGLGLFLSRGETVARRSAARLVLDLLSLVTQDFPRSATIALWDATYTSLDGLLGDHGPAATAAQADEISRRAGIVGGREAWPRALDRLRERTQRKLARARDPAAGAEQDDEDDSDLERPEDLERVLEALPAVRVTFDALAEALLPLSRPGTYARLLDALLTVLAALGLHEAILDPEIGPQAAADLRAWNSLLEALQGLADMDRSLPVQGRDRVLQPDEFAAQVAEVAAGLRVHTEGRGEGRVVALDVHDALQTRFDYVFVLGLTEGLFPRRSPVDPLFPDDQRRALAARGLDIRPRLEAHEEEAYLFHLAVSTASKRLYLCYPDTDAEGSPLLRSFYVDEAERLLPALRETRRELRLRDVVPPLGEAASPRELLERALLLRYEPPRDDQAREAADLPHADAALQALARFGEGEEYRQRRDLALQGARVERLRDGRLAGVTTDAPGAGPPGPFDGVLPDACRGRLAERFGPNHRFSAGQLAGYGKCPMAFFFERVLGLQELEEPGEEVSALELGRLTHRVLADFYRARPEHDGGRRHVALDADDEQALAQARELLLAAADRALSAFERAGLTSHEELWRVTRELLLRRLETWLTAETEIPAKLDLPVTPVPARFEYPYGLLGAETLVLDLPGAGPVTVVGRLDRLDEVGPDGFVVYDYKRGQASSAADMRRGEDFQLIFYALAADRLIYPGARRCLGWAYVRVGYPVREALREGLAKTADEVRDLVEQGLAMADRHVTNMRSGWFAWAHLCRQSRHCPFAGVCRYDARRARRRGFRPPREGEADE